MVIVSCGRQRSPVWKKGTKRAIFLTTLTLFFIRINFIRIRGLKIGEI